jgi:hypothetical protein
MKPTDDLEARIMNRLQDMKSGQTIKQLAEYLGESEGKILVVLAPYVSEGHVTQSESGWILVRK